MAFKSIPNVPIMVNVRNTLNPPIKHIASLINPDNAGRPKPAKNAMATNAVYTGTFAPIPPKPGFPANSAS